MIVDLVYSVLNIANCLLKLLLVLSVHLIVFLCQLDHLNNTSGNLINDSRIIRSLLQDWDEEVSVALSM